MRVGLLWGLLMLALPLSQARAADLPGSLVSVEWLAENIDADGLRIIDIRPADQPAYISGAVAAPYGATPWRAEVDGVPAMLPPVEDISALIGSLGVDNDTSVVIVPIGQNATDFGAAARVFWTFRVLGHEDVAILDGGMTRWMAMAQPVANSPSQPEAARFAGSLQPELMATTADVQAVVAGQRDAALIDARPIAQVVGRTSSGVATRPGHIPGAISADQNMAWDVTSGTLNDADSMAYLYSAVPQEGEIISYCNTGHWAATNWFVMTEVLGRSDVKLYDASIAGWSRADTEASPMVTGLPDRPE